MKIEKCHVGYIRYQKKIDWLWLLACIVVAIGIFLVGYLWMHTRANVFTVLAVLMVLPAAKRIVSLVVFLPRKGVAKERYDEIQEKAGEGTLFAEYVFTSTEKIMHLDFLLIKNGNVLGVMAPSYQDAEYMINYLEENVHRIAPDYHVKVFDRDEKLLNQLDKLTTIPGAPEKEEKLAAHLRSLAV
jgi:hypothetical protein